MSERTGSAAAPGRAAGSVVLWRVAGHAAPGEGPALHHPYSETFVVVPPRTAHGFRAIGPERLRLVAIQPRMETTPLGDPPDA